MRSRIVSGTSARRRRCMDRDSQKDSNGSATQSHRRPASDETSQRLSPLLLSRPLALAARYSRTSPIAFSFEYLLAHHQHCIVASSHRRITVATQIALAKPFSSFCCGRPLESRCISARVLPASTSTGELLGAVSACRWVRLSLETRKKGEKSEPATPVRCKARMTASSTPPSPNFFFSLFSLLLLHSSVPLDCSLCDPALASPPAASQLSFYSSSPSTLNRQPLAPRRLPPAPCPPLRPRRQCRRSSRHARSSSRQGGRSCPIRSNNCSNR